MSLADALAHLDPATGDPTVGYISVADLKACLTQVYADFGIATVAPQIDGSRGGNVALTNLLIALDQAAQIIDNTLV